MNGYGKSQTKDKSAFAVYLTLNVPFAVVRWTMDAISGCSGSSAL